MKEIIMQHPITKEFFMVSKVKAMGDRFAVAENKRKLTEEEKEKYKEIIKGSSSSETKSEESQ